MEIGIYGIIERNIKKRMEDYLKGREITTVVKDEKSEWREVKSRVPLIIF